MSRALTGVALLLCTSVVAADDVDETAVALQCSGRLRHGVMAIGGETTGTTLTSNDVVWELQLHRDIDRDFAAKHHKKSVRVAGTVRKVSGIETKSRWIIDVRELEISVTEQEKVPAKITITGTLQSGDGACNEDAGFQVRSGDQIWPLKFSSESQLKRAFQQHVGQSVRIAGHLAPRGVKDQCAPATIEVATISEPESTPEQR